MQDNTYFSPNRPPWPLKIYGLGNKKLTQYEYQKRFFQVFQKGLQQILVTQTVDPEETGLGYISQKELLKEIAGPIHIDQKVLELLQLPRINLSLSTQHKGLWENILSAPEGQFLQYPSDCNYLSAEEERKILAKMFPEDNPDLRTNLQIIKWEEKALTPKNYLSWDYFNIQVALAFDLVTFFHKELQSELVMLELYGYNEKLEMSQIDISGRLNFWESSEEFYQKMFLKPFSKLPLFKKIPWHQLPESMLEADPNLNESDVLEDTLLKYYYFYDELTAEDRRDLFSLVLDIAGKACWLFALNLQTELGQAILKKAKAGELLWNEPDIKYVKDQLMYPYLRVFVDQDYLLICRSLPFTEQLGDFYRSLSEVQPLPESWRPQSLVGYDYSQFELINKFD